MASLYLSDLFTRAGIDPNRVMLIRHSLNNEQFKKCYDLGMIYEYTKHQLHNFANSFKGCTNYPQCRFIKNID